MKAIWNGKTLAESNATLIIEGNHYFPPESINESYFEKSDYTTNCPWKGEASYFTLKVGGKENKNAAWYYTDTKSAANEIKNYVAFWKGVEITE